MEQNKEKMWTVTRNGVDLGFALSESAALKYANFSNSRFPRDRFDARRRRHKHEWETAPNTQGLIDVCKVCGLERA